MESFVILSIILGVMCNCERNIARMIFLELLFLL